MCHHWSVCVCQHAGHKLLDVHSQHVPGNAERPEQVGGQLAQGAAQCRSPSGPGCAAAEGKADSGCILVWSQDSEDLLSFFLICTGDNLSKQIGWDVSVHAAQEGGREPTEDEPAGGTVLMGTSAGPEGERQCSVRFRREADWTTLTALTSQVSVFCRYTFGSALFVGWVAGGLALIGGIMMCLACRGLIPEESR